MKKFLVCILFLLSFSILDFGAGLGQSGKAADGTYLYAVKDGQELFLDYYAPAVQDSVKPTVIFVFGGGFMSGKRDSKSYMEWFKALTLKGYGVVSIDYRLGLKGVKYGKNLKFIKSLRNAVLLAVDDLFSATAFLLDNAESFNIDPSNIVVSGSSAGAITALQAEWDICNSHEAASVLPEGFNYAGVMSFSGAIFSFEGPVKFNREPCPIFLCHGTEDNIVPYGQINLFRIFFEGSDRIARRLAKEKRNYSFYRFEGNNHEIAGTMMHNLERELKFLEEKVAAGKREVIDTLLRDPSIETPAWVKGGLNGMYNN